MGAVVWYQCCGCGMFNPEFSMGQKTPDPGSARIPDPDLQQRF